MVEENEILTEDIVLEEPENIGTEEVHYEKLDKKDLVRLLNEKDKVLEGYEESRNHDRQSFSDELNNMNEYYIKKIREFQSLIEYYERKTDLVISLLTIEKDSKKGGNTNDSIQ